MLITIITAGRFIEHAIQFYEKLNILTMRLKLKWEPIFYQFIKLYWLSNSSHLLDVVLFGDFLWSLNTTHAKYSDTITLREKHARWMMEKDHGFLILKTIWDRFHMYSVQGKNLTRCSLKYHAKAWRPSCH